MEHKIYIQDEIPNAEKIEELQEGVIEPSVSEWSVAS